MLHMYRSKTVVDAVDVKVKLLGLLGALIFAAHVNNIASADELYTMGLNNTRSSDDIQLGTLEFNYKNHRRSYFWPYEEVTDKKFDWGITAQSLSGEAESISFSANVVSFSLGWHYSPDDYVVGKLGYHDLLSDDTKVSKNRTVSEFVAHTGSEQTGHIYYHYANDFVYQLSLQPAGIKQFLHASRHELGLKWKPVAKARLEETVSLWNLSDDNVRKSSKFDAWWQLTQGWVWLGLSYETEGYQNNVDGYWTPQKFQSFGLVFDSSVPLAKNEKVSASFSASLAKIKEDDFPQGNASSFSAGLDYKLMNAFALRCAYNYLNSQQQTSDWSEKSFRVSLNGIF